MPDISQVIKDDRFLALPGEERHKVIDAVLAKDEAFSALPKDEQSKARSALYTKTHDPKGDLPTEIMGVKVPPDVAAGVVGIGHGMQWAEEGIAQLTGVDVNQTPVNGGLESLGILVAQGIFGDKKDQQNVKDQANAAQEGFKKLKQDQKVGTSATVGDVAGQVASPTNLAIPGAIGTTVLKMAASGAAIGGATAALSPVAEGESRVENMKEGALFMALGNTALGLLYKGARGLKGREAIPLNGEMPKEVKEAIKTLNPGLTDETLEVMNQRVTGEINRQDKALKLAAKFPEADESWLKAKKVPKEFKEAMKDPETSGYMKNLLERRSQIKGAITDDHEMYQFLNREAENAAGIRDIEASRWAEARARENPLTPEPLTPEERAQAVLEDRIARQTAAMVRGQEGVAPKPFQEKTRLPEAKVLGDEPKPARERTLQEIAEDARAKPPFMQDASDRLAIAASRKPIWVPPGQEGRISPALLNRMAAAGVGSAAGAYLDPDNPLQGAIFGALAGAGLYEAGALLGKGKKYLSDNVFVKDERPRIDGFADARDGEIAAWQRTTMQRQLKAEGLVKPGNLDRDKALYLAATGEARIPLTKAEADYIKLVRDNMDEIGQLGLDSGTIEHLRDEYITRLVDFGPAKSKSEILNLIKQVGGKGGGGSTSTKTRFNKERVFESLKDLEAAGYKLKTHNLSEIMGVYNKSVISAIENKKMIEGIKASVAPNGDRLIIPLAGLRSLPRGYETINHPQLFGQAVHSDIASSMRFLFDKQDPSTVGAAIQAMSTAIKRGDVSFSLFHAMSLGQAYIGAIGGPKGVMDILRAPFGKGGMEKMVQAFRTGGKGDIVDLGLRSGLRVGSATEDVDRTLLTAALRDVGSVADRIVPMKLGEKAATGIEKVNKLVDNITWGHAHTGMKLQVFSDKVETLMKNNITAHEKKPSIPLMTREQAGVIAAKFANTIFGGLDYRRLAEGIQNRYGRDLALWALSPSSRRVAQIAMFAPDWTLSTLQSLTGALGKGSGIGGVMSPKTLADLHRQYLARSAFYFLTIGDGLNYMYSGHHLWENKDPTRIDLGDGRTLQLSKHFTEPIHDIMHPDQATLNKLGVLPKQIGEQLMNKEYLSAGGGPSITKPDDSALTAAGKRLGHLVKSPIPIPVQQGIKQGPEAMALGMIGLPIYGTTYKEREAAKKQAALTRLKNDMDPEKRAVKEAKKREKERQKRIAEGQ